MKQPHGALVELAPLLLEGDHDIPADLLSQLQRGLLGVERVQQQDIEEAAPVLLQEAAKQTESGGIFALARL